MDELLEKIHHHLVKQHHEWTICQEQHSLIIENDAGIEAFLAVSGEQILVETILFPSDAICKHKRHEFNADVLCIHKLFPLSTVGICKINEDEYYSLFGALSAQSTLASIDIEISTLFNNVENFLEFSQEYRKGA